MPIACLLLAVVLLTAVATVPATAGTVPSPAGVSDAVGNDSVATEKAVLHSTAEPGLGVRLCVEVLDTGVLAEVVASLDRPLQTNVSIGDVCDHGDDGGGGDDGDSGGGDDGDGGDGDGGDGGSGGGDDGDGGDGGSGGGGDGGDGGSGGGGDGGDGGSDGDTEAPDSGSNQTEETRSRNRGGGDGDHDTTNDSPAIEVVDWGVDPTRVAVGEPATVSVEVVNHFWRPESTRFVLVGDGEAIEGRTVLVPGRRRTTVEFEHAFDEPGEHTLGVRSLGTKRVSVTAPPTPEPTPTDTPTDSPPPTEEAGFDPMLIIVGALVLSVITAIGGYRLLEKPSSGR